MLGRDYLTTWNDWWDRAPKEFLHLFYSGVRTAEKKELVILSHVLADEVNVGYGSYTNESVVSVNGIGISDMKDFVRRVDEAEGLLEFRTSLGATIVFDVKAARDREHSILARYRLTSDRSADL